VVHRRPALPEWNTVDHEIAGARSADDPDPPSVCFAAAVGANTVAVSATPSGFVVGLALAGSDGASSKS